MRITKEQKEFLKSLKCQRIRDNEISQEIISNFESERGAQLVHYLKEIGMQEDIDGTSAFYIIRNEQNIPLLFFSLRCGLLFEPSILSEIDDKISNQKKFLELLDEGPNSNNPLVVSLMKDISSLAIKRNMTTEQMIDNLRKQARLQLLNIKQYKYQYHEDEKTEGNKPINRVHTTYPGIELMHFCVNDKARSYWKSANFRQSMGEVLFWWFIIPKIESVTKIAGCYYAYLFAADASEDQTLINYYNVALKFEKPIGIGTDKPRYDYCCEFLIQKIDTLLSFRKKYFANFNIDQSFSDIV